MQGIGNLVDAPKPHALVRNFSMAQRWELARDPLHHPPESPDRSHNGGMQQPPDVAAAAKRRAVKGAGVGIPFGIEMHRRSHVPQGLIATAHGGTSMEQWDPARKNLGGASLYGSMLTSLRLVGQPIAGVLWYQGCSDANSAAAAVYTKRMIALVAAVRRDLKQAKLPWMVVQIGRVVGQSAAEREWNSIQEQQRLLPQRIKQLEVVPAVDLELDDQIHISGKAFAQLGNRLARIADRLVYGNRAEAPPIQPIAARNLNGTTIEVRFANVVGGLRAHGTPAGFMLVDRQHTPRNPFYKTVLTKDRALLHLTGTEHNNFALMYGWGKNSPCTVTDARGMGIPVFGPLHIANQPPVTPWFTTWDASGIIPGEDTARMAKPTVKSVGRVERKSWTGGNFFVNQHDLWLGKSGHAAFFGEITLAEAMSLEMRFGYDGPIRLWIGSQEVHRDMKGINPAIIDHHRIPLRLPRGRHPITVLMALNRGLAWGFFLRFARTKLAKNVDSTTAILPIPLG